MASIINAATSGGLVTTADTSGILQLQTAGTTAVTVDAAGGVKTLNTISVGNATPSTSGAGITFPADQTILGASTNANTLDDYEEGTFTLSLQSVASGSVTFGGADEILGIYTKIGRQVHVMAKLVTASVSTPGGDISFQGLPFTTASGITYLKVLVAIEYPAVASVPANTGSTYFTLYLNSTNNMYVYFGDASTTPAGVAFRAGTSISFNFSYTVN